MSTVNRNAALWLAVAMVLSAGVAMAGDDPAKVDPAHFKVIFENAKVRVLEFQNKPAEKTPMHSHPAHVVYALTSGKVKHTMPDGKIIARQVAAKPLARGTAGPTASLEAIYF